MKMKRDSDCIFCKIVNGELPSYKIHENEKFYACLDLAQFTDGHTIVMPKEHHELIFDVPEFAEYMEFAKEVAEHFRTLGFKYVDTMSWGRMVKHAHFHLVPHNDEQSDWKNALQGVGALQQDKSRWPSKEKGQELVKKFQLQN